MVSAGAMDSMVNHYTAARRLRHDDAYTPDARAGMRPDDCTIVYTRILKSLYPDVPVLIGGIEASQRRLTHYDYWKDTLRPSILVESGADILQYGMGEQSTLALADYLNRCRQSGEDWRNEEQLRTIRQIAYLADEAPADAIVLHSHEQAMSSKRAHAENFRLIEIESNKIHPATIVQPVGDRYVVVTPTAEQMTTAELDSIYDLPFTYQPHPKYQGKRIPAYEMIRFSVCMHRGCFGGCSFCTISAHQGKQITSRSKESILRQVRRLAELPEWRGVLSDLGGPSANMYAITGRDRSLCERCARPSCLQPAICPNLHRDFGPLLDVYRAVDAMPEVKHSFVGSGIRYDLMDENYGRELITRHVSGRLKVAPEHTVSHVVRLMRKPDYAGYLDFREFFYRVNREAGMRQQIIPYFISSHPGCTEADMRKLQAEMQRENYQPEQVQDFTPTPMTLSTTMYYTGLNPYTMEPVFVERNAERKKQQKQYFFHQNKRKI